MRSITVCLILSERIQHIPKGPKDTRWSERRIPRKAESSNQSFHWRLPVRNAREYIYAAVRLRVNESAVSVMPLARYSPVPQICTCPQMSQITIYSSKRRVHPFSENTGKCSSSILSTEWSAKPAKPQMVRRCSKHIPWATMLRRNCEGRRKASR